MKYLCLIYEDISGQPAMTNAEIKEAMEENYQSFTGELKESGRCIRYGAVPPGVVTTVRVRNGRLSATDGPFAETKEQLGVYYLIEAQDLDEAIRIAGKMPSAKRGSVEVRPVIEF